MKKFTVLYQNPELPLAAPPLHFHCDAEDGDHAEEQCENAYPQSTIAWVAQTDDLQEALNEYYAQR